MLQNGLIVHFARLQPLNEVSVLSDTSWTEAWLSQRLSPGNGGHRQEAVVIDALWQAQGQGAIILV
jgi:hypothetical protein